jgi:hypothetical protein
MMQQRWAIGAAARALAKMYEGRYLAVAALVVVTAACATLSPSSPAEEKVKVATERATARWNAIIGKDFATAYGYMSPTSRATVTPQGFKTVASRIAYREAKVTEAACDAGTCRVKLMITYDAPAPVPTPIQGKNTLTMKGIVTPLEENWVIDQGQLWYVWPI